MAPEIIKQSAQILNSVSKGQKLTILLLLIVAGIGFGSLIFWNTRPDYQVLFSNLSQEDAGEMIAKLKEKKIPYQLSQNGSTILIPREQVYDTRLALATEGLPKGGGVGFEVFDRTNFGATDFVQKMNYQRAIQGELTRTIKQFKEIEQARVHIVTPKDSLFVEEQKKPTASVLIKTRSGMTLGSSQVEGITHLVASAVEGLEPSNVTVVDNTGKMLSKKNDTNSIGSLSTTQLEYHRNIEEGYKKKIQGILEEVLGPNKAIARVSAEIDFQQVDITEERFDPSTVIRSEQKTVEKSTNSTGTPKITEDKEGFVSLRTTPEAKGQQKMSNSPIPKSQPTSPSGTLNSSERQNEVRNYEITKINKLTKGSTGLIKKISAAVIIDGVYKEAVGLKGAKTKQYSSRSPEEMKNFENIVKKAIGFDEVRGDQVEVTNMPFAVSALEEEAKIEAASPWKEYLFILYKPIISLLLAVLFILFVIKPILKKKIFSKDREGERLLLEQLKQLQQNSQMNLSSEIPHLGLTMDPGKSGVGNLPKSLEKKQIVQAVEQDPGKAAEIVKAWLHEGGISDAMATDKIMGPQKAAIFLLSLGEDLSSEIIKQLEKEEIKKLSNTISKITSVSPKTVESIYSEFNELTNSERPIHLGRDGGTQFVQKVLSKAISGEKAQLLIEELKDEGKWNLFKKIRTLDPKTIFNIIRNEHPQTIAIILAHLDFGQTAGIVAELPGPLQAEVACRMAELENVDPEILEEIDQALQESMVTVKGMEGQKIGGVRSVAEILNQLDNATEGNILKGIEEYKPGLADEIRQLMFVFEDLAQIDDRGIMAILKEVNNEELLLAMKTTSEELKEKLFKNMSERAAQMVREDLEVMGPVRLKDVEVAQQSIIKIAKKLESEGKLVLASKGKEDVFV